MTTFHTGEYVYYPQGPAHGWVRGQSADRPDNLAVEIPGSPLRRSISPAHLQAVDIQVGDLVQRGVTRAKVLRLHPRGLFVEDLYGYPVIWPTGAATYVVDRPKPDPQVEVEAPKEPTTEWQFEASDGAVLVRHPSARITERLLPETYRAIVAHGPMTPRPAFHEGQEVAAVGDPKALIHDDFTASDILRVVVRLNDEVVAVSDEAGYLAAFDTADLALPGASR